MYVVFKASNGYCGCNTEEPFWISDKIDKDDRFLNDALDEWGRDQLDSWASQYIEILMEDYEDEPYEEAYSKAEDDYWDNCWWGMDYNVPEDEAREYLVGYNTEIEPLWYEGKGGTE